MVHRTYTIKWNDLDRLNGDQDLVPILINQGFHVHWSFAKNKIEPDTNQYLFTWRDNNPGFGFRTFYEESNLSVPPTINPISMYSDYSNSYEFVGEPSVPESFDYQDNQNEEKAKIENMFKPQVDNILDSKGRSINLEDE